MGENIQEVYDIIEEALHNTKDNGYDLDEWNTGEIARDMKENLDGIEEVHMGHLEIIIEATRRRWLNE